MSTDGVPPAVAATTSQSNCIRHSDCVVVGSIVAEAIENTPTATRASVAAMVGRSRLASCRRACIGFPRGFVQSDSLVKGMWAELVTRYRDEIAGRAPFSGDIDGSEPVDTASVVALLGQESGLVARIGEAAGSGELTAQAAAWLTRAGELSDALFEPGTDRLKPLRVRMTGGGSACAVCSAPAARTG